MATFLLNLVSYIVFLLILFRSYAKSVGPNSPNTVKASPQSEVKSFSHNMNQLSSNNESVVLIPNTDKNLSKEITTMRANSNPISKDVNGFLLIDSTKTIVTKDKSKDPSTKTTPSDIKDEIKDPSVKNKPMENVKDKIKGPQSETNLKQDYTNSDTIDSSDKDQEKLNDDSGESLDQDFTKDVIKSKPETSSSSHKDLNLGHETSSTGDAESSHFFAYFVTVVILCIIAYIVFHNKQKIIAIVIEGHSKRVNRRPNSGNYKRLETNVEEVMGKIDTSTVNKKYIY